MIYVADCGQSSNNSMTKRDVETRPRNEREGERVRARETDGETAIRSDAEMPWRHAQTFDITSPSLKMPRSMTSHSGLHFFAASPSVRVRLYSVGGRDGSIRINSNILCR